MFDEKQENIILNLLKEKQDAVIIVHRNPDGDALGSSLGLNHFLKQKFDVDAQIIVPDPYPDFLEWMPGNENILIATKNTQRASAIIKSCKLIFCLDFNHPKRVADLENDLINASAYKVMIDHHREPEEFCDAVLSEITASSTCELVLKWIFKLKDEDQINLDAAACLYTGMMTDTGSFRFESATATTYNYAAFLINKGLKHWLIHEAISNQNSFNKLKLWGLAMHERLVKIKGYNVAYVYLMKSDLVKYNYKEGDLEGLVNFALSIKGVKLAALFSEREGKVRISFRSVGDYPANEFSKNNFEGGGHLNAAGGISHTSMEKTLEKFNQLILEQFQLKEG